MSDRSKASSQPLDPEVLLERLENFVNPGRARVYRLLGLNNIEWRAEGSTVTDSQGREFIDFCAGYAVMNCGHRHPRIVAAIEDQLGRMGLSSKMMLSQPEVLLGEQLADMAPGDLTQSFFCATGTEANEVAIKMARIFTGRANFVAAENGYHGKTMGSLSATAKGSYRDAFGPLVPGFTHVPYNDIEALEAAIDHETAAVILEPIQGEAGAVTPDDDYLPAVRELCDQNGSLLILDEIQSGLGRTGRNFASEHYGVVPDIMTLAKGLGGGLIPIGVAIARPGIFQILDDNPWIHSTTTGGNPLAATAGLATLDVIRDERLAEQAAQKGSWAMNELQRLQSEYPGVIETVQGQGLLLGIRFTNPSGGIMVLSELFERQVIVIPSLMDWTVMRIAPPLNIPEATLKQGFSILEEALSTLAPDIMAMD